MCGHVAALSARGGACLGQGGVDGALSIDAPQALLLCHLHNVKLDLLLFQLHITDLQTGRKVQLIASLSLMSGGAMCNSKAHVGGRSV
jgi:hypothetical protein